MHARIRIAVALVLAFSIASRLTVAQEGAAAFPLFLDQTPLKLRITGPFRQLERDDPDERPEHDTVLEIEGADGETTSLDVEIRVRGKSRADLCDFPPLRLDFSRPAVEGTVFAGQNQLKLVTLCKGSNTYRTYLAQEYLIYRFFNVLTDRSFRVRWAEIEYVYTDSRRPQTELAPAFLIEADWEAAERHGLPVVETESISADNLAADHTALLVLFQYMVGNTDFSMLAPAPDEDDCCHNSKVIGREGSDLVILPYDFDQAGLINTEYSIPSEVLRIDRVTQRLYRGFCKHDRELAAAIDRVNSDRPQLEAELDAEFIPDRARDRALRFLERSYEMINDSERFADAVSRDCR